MKRTVKATDIFGWVTGSVGLIADVVGLGGLVVASRVEQSNQFFVWVLLFLMTLYSVVLVSFFLRRHFYSVHRRRIRSLDLTDQEYLREIDFFNRGMERIEQGSVSATCLVGVPIIICFVCAAFYVDSANSGFDRAFGGIPSLIFVSNRLEYTLHGALYGLFLGIPLCLGINMLIRQIFLALEPEYYR